MDTLIPVLFFFSITVSAALEWTSEGILPNGSVVPACPGQDVTLAWSCTAGADEHLINVEWHYTPDGEQDDVVLATEVMGNFFSAPGFSQHLQYIPNAGIRLHNVNLQHGGAYSVTANLDLHGSTVTGSQTVHVQVSEDPITEDGRLHAEMLTDAVYNNQTRQFHVQLACGRILPVWQSKTGVVWRTPTGETLPSTSNAHGRFLLTVPNPVTPGEYTCVIDDNSPASLCVQNGSPVHRGATVAVEGVEARVVLMEARLGLMQQREEEMLAQLTNFREKNAALEAQLNSSQQKTTELESQLNSYQTQFNKTLQKQTALEGRQNELDSQLATYEGQTNSTLQQVSDLDGQLASLEQKNTVLTQQLDTLHDNFTSLIAKLSTQAVVFHAQLTHNSDVMTGGHVIPDHVLLNQGYRYYATTGEFTAPHSGTYFLFATTSAYNYSTSAPSEASLAIMVDDTWVSYIYTQSVNYYEQGTCVYAGHMTSGQKAWLRATRDGHFAAHITTFSGFLITVD